MIITRLWAENVRNISKRITISPEPTGITIFHAPNEFGKSTLAEIITTLFERDHTSNHAALKAMQRNDGPTGPTMGAEFEIDGVSYWLEKTWLKGKNATLKQIAPEAITYASGADSEKELARLVRENFDEDLWNIVQVAQSKSASTFEKLREVQSSSFLSQAFENLSAGNVSDLDSNLYESIKKEYLEWFTEAGRARKEKDSRGKLLIDKSDEVSRLKTEIVDLQRKLTDAEKLETEAKLDSESFEKLVSIQTLQHKQQELNRVSTVVEGLKKVQTSISDLELANTFLKQWNENDYKRYQSLSAGFEAFKALPKLKVEALKSFKLLINNEDREIGNEEIIDIPIVDGLEITFADLAKVSFPTEATGVDLKGMHDEFLELGQKIQVSNLEEADKQNGVFREWRQLKAKESEILESETFSNDEALYIELTKEKESQAELWIEAIEHPIVKQSDLLSLKEEGGEKKGRYTEIRSDGTYSRLDRASARIRTLGYEIEDLTLQRDAIELLMLTVDNFKNQKANEYSKIFDDELNTLVKIVFSDKTKFSVSQDFAISGRNQDGTLLNIEQLSIGAKEQISFLARLAIAKIASKSGSVPLILDDDLVSTDEARLTKLGELMEAISDIQIIIFTCHPERYKALASASTYDLRKLVN